MGEVSEFAPTSGPPSAFVYRGQEISGDTAAAQGLVCNEDATPIMHCYYSLADADAGHRSQTDR